MPSTTDFAQALALMQARCRVLEDLLYEIVEEGRLGEVRQAQVLRLLKTSPLKRKDKKQ